MVLSDEERKVGRKKSKEKYRKSSKGKAKEKVYSKEYRSRPEVKAKQKEYESTPEGKARISKLAQIRNQRPEVKASKKKSRQDNRLNVLQTYSKRLSNNNVPCCNCCGLNTHSDFLALDHIAGKKQMDSEPELVKLGYRSTLRSNVLIKWIINNNFPKGFQILCTNCNTAKAYPKNNNECPMKNKPH